MLCLAISINVQTSQQLLNTFTYRSICCIYYQPLINPRLIFSVFNIIPSGQFKSFNSWLSIFNSTSVLWDIRADYFNISE